MITDFESITKEISFREMEYYIPLLTNALKQKVGKENAISTPDIIKGVHNYELKTNKNAIQLRPERIRIMVRYIIVSDKIPGLISSGNGFYVADNKKDITTCIQSIDDRIKAMETKRKAWIRQMNELFFENQKLF